MRESLTPGVWGVVATPFQGSTLDVDTDSLAGLVSYYESIGATGLTVLGVFGEAAALTAAERSLVLEVVVEETRLPLVVGVTSLFTGTAVEEIRSIQAATGDRLAAVMVQANSAEPRRGHRAPERHPPVHRRQRGAAGLPAGQRRHASAPRRSSPWCRPAASSPRSRPRPRPRPWRSRHLTAALDVSVFGGLGGQGLLDELMAGAAGAMTGFSYPEALIACVRAWQKDGYEAARDALLPYLPLINFEQQARIALAIRKECLHQRGLIADAGVRAPAAPFPEVLRTGLRTHLAEAAEALGPNPAAALTTAGRN